jgi:GTP-binding protein
MRREGYELQVGRPQVIEKEVDGKTMEPFETLVIDVPSEHSGKAIELVTARKGDMLVMEPKGDLQHLEFHIPSRGLIGLRNNILTATAGTAIMTHRFTEFGEVKGEIATRLKGSLVSMEAGQVLAHALNRLQDRGKFFVEAGDQIYKGQVVGEHARDKDLDLNLIKGKQLTNMRKSGTDAATNIAPKIDFSLEQSMEYIAEDELLEVTPENLRMRKIPKPKSIHDR